MYKGQNENDGNVFKLKYCIILLMKTFTLNIPTNIKLMAVNFKKESVNQRNC